jgi:hypothetical protein
MAGRRGGKTTFDKLQRERARREKQAAKRARRQGGAQPEDNLPRPVTPTPLGGPVGEAPPEGSGLPREEG